MRPYTNQQLTQLTVELGVSVPNLRKPPPLLAQRAIAGRELPFLGSLCGYLAGNQRTAHARATQALEPLATFLNSVQEPDHCIHRMRAAVLAPFGSYLWGCTEPDRVAATDKCCPGAGDPLRQAAMLVNSCLQPTHR
jgi:hypothetical protein